MEGLECHAEAFDLDSVVCRRCIQSGMSARPEENTRCCASVEDRERFILAGGGSGRFNGRDDI